MKRYERNMMTFSPEENDSFKDFKICVVGCGGLGGYAIELLGRLGIRHITAVDGDVFEESNLNRQILSSEPLLGSAKVLAAKERMKKVNSNVTVTPIHAFLNESNGKSIIEGHHVVIDALDNIKSRLTLAKLCSQSNITLVHGAIGGWYGQVSVIPPDSTLLQEIYSMEEEKGLEAQLGNPAFTPALIASLQISETMKFLLKKEDVLVNKLLTVNLLNCEFDVIDFSH